MSLARCLVLVSVLLGTLMLGLVGPAPASVQTGPDLCYGGVTSGRWDLPTRPGDLGFARGLLAAGRRPLFHLKARLSELPTPALSLRQGEIGGFLYSLNDPDDAPDYAVKGTWNGSAVGNTGTWEASILVLASGDIIGSLTGQYNDPGPYSHRVVGRYKGEWVICDHP